MFVLPVLLSPRPLAQAIHRFVLAGPVGMLQRPGRRWPEANYAINVDYGEEVTVSGSTSVKEISPP